MELSFSIRQLVVYIYSLRGDIGKAIDEARQMYEKAETMRYDLGIAFRAQLSEMPISAPICPKKPLILIRKPSVIRLAFGEQPL